MTLYMDIHGKAEGATAQGVADAHLMDVQVQAKYGVQYLTYWFNEDAGRIFCLCEAPSKQASCRKRAPRGSRPAGGSADRSAAGDR